MISLCIPSEVRQIPWLKILLKSVTGRTTLINDIQITVNEYFGEPQFAGKISWRGNKVRILSNDVNSTNLRHWTALSQSVEHAKNDLVLLCDSDVCLMAGVDTFFYELLGKFNLDIVGVSHYLAVNEAFGFMPNVIFTLLKRSQFEDCHYLRDEVPPWNLTKEQVQSLKFLNFSGACLASKRQYYPNPDGHAETGSNLAAYVNEKKLNWLSFQTTDIHNYTSRFWRSNLKGLKIEKRPIIYHQSGSAGFVESSRGRNQIDEFKEAFLQSKGENV